MKRMQFSLAVLLGVVTFLGIACASLVNASPLWAAVVVSAVAMALMTTTVGAVYLPPPLRTFCGGVAIFGWAYLLLNTASLSDAAPYLATRPAIDWLYSRVNESQQSGEAVARSSGQAYRLMPLTSPAAAPQPARVHPNPNSSAEFRSYMGSATSLVLQPAAVPYEEFQRIGHALSAMLLGLLGGLAAGFFAGLASKHNQDECDSQPDGQG